MSTNDQTPQYYAKIIAKNILSGNNSCGTLASAAATGNSKFFEKCAEGVVGVLVEERDQARRDALQNSSGTGADRFALEFIAQNLGGTVQITDPAIIQSLEQRLGRRLR